MEKNELVKNIFEMDDVDIENADLADLLSYGFLGYQQTPSPVTNLRR